MKHRFGELVLDLEAGRLLGPGGEIRLRPQAFKLLVVLVENAPRLLSHEELLDRVWGVEHLSPASVKQAVSEVRQALGDNPAQPSAIETVPRRGYRFIAPLTRIEEEALEEVSGVLLPETARKLRPDLPRRLALVLGALSLASGVSAAALLVRAEPGDTVPQASTAVAGPAAVSPAPFGSAPRPWPGYGYGLRRRPFLFFNRSFNRPPGPRPGARMRRAGPWSDSTVSPRSPGSASKRRPWRSRAPAFSGSRETGGPASTPGRRSPP